MNVLITGCSSGFGKLAVEEFALEDHTVFATMRKPKGKNAEAAKQLSSLKNVSVIEMDVTSDASVEQAVEECMARGGVDAVIHNAGIGTSGVAEANTVELFSRVLDVNLLGVHRLNRCVLPHMRGRRSGLLMYVSSGLGRTVLPYMSFYCASKFALEAYAESCAYELATHGVNTTIFQPGAFPTGFRANIIEPDDAERLKDYAVEQEEALRIHNGVKEMLKSEAAPDPRDVTNAMLSVAAMRPEERPLRVALRRDSGGLKMINQICSEVQGAIMRGMKLEHRLPARPQL